MGFCLWRSRFSPGGLAFFSKEHVGLMVVRVCERKWLFVPLWPQTAEMAVEAVTEGMEERMNGWMDDHLPVYFQ